MKKFQFLFVVLFLAAQLLTACGPESYGAVESATQAEQYLTAGLIATGEWFVYTITPAAEGAGIAAAVVVVATGTMEASEACQEAGGQLIMTTGIEGNTVPQCSVDFEHITQDGGPGRVQQRDDAVRALYDNEKKQADACYFRPEDGAVLLSLVLEYSSSTHPNRNPYQGVGFLWNPNVTERNVTIMGYKSSLSEIPDVKNGRFQLATQDQAGACANAHAILRETVNGLVQMNGWGDLWP